MKSILYSFRRCPYAMRARMAIQYSNISVELREVILRDKPAEMLSVSEDTTVPLLVLSNGNVINESLDIMYWALSQHDPENWLLSNEANITKEYQQLITRNDDKFKQSLDCYKYVDRFPEHSQQHYRTQGEQFLIELESRLNVQRYLFGNHPSIADIAIFPFIRQFAHVDKHWFYSAPYPHLISWLDRFLESAAFGAIMVKYDQWRTGNGEVVFP